MLKLIYFNNVRFTGIFQNIHKILIDSGFRNVIFGSSVWVMHN